jgi:hypothetical protein
MDYTPTACDYGGSQVPPEQRLTGAGAQGAVDCQMSFALHGWHGSGTHGVLGLHGTHGTGVHGVLRGGAAQGSMAGAGTGAHRGTGDAYPVRTELSRLT